VRNKSLSAAHFVCIGPAIEWKKRNSLLTSYEYPTLFSERQIIVFTLFLHGDTPVPAHRSLHADPSNLPAYAGKPQ
jgi:hypothetical protein